MKKMNKKGFTLIELLAVIVILAIIALVATPIVLNVVDNAKKSAAKASANNVITALNNNEQLAGFAGTSDIVTSTDAVTNIKNYVIEKKEYATDSVPVVSAEDTAVAAIVSTGSLGTADVSGEQPTIVILTTDNNKVVSSGCVNIQGYDVTVANGVATDATQGTTCTIK